MGKPRPKPFEATVADAQGNGLIVLSAHTTRRAALNQLALRAMFSASHYKYRVRDNRTGEFVASLETR